MSFLETLTRVSLSSVMLLTACDSGPNTQKSSIQPPIEPNSNVISQAQATPAPPSEPGKRVIFGTPEPTPPSLRFQDIHTYLKYPTIISIGGESYVGFMEKKGDKIYIYESQIPYKGTVVPQEGLTTHLLPTTDSKINSLGEEYSLKQGPIQGELKHFVEVQRNGTRKELWVARLLMVRMGNNPPVLTLVFNAVEFKEGGSGKTATYISLEKSVPKS